MLCLQLLAVFVALTFADGAVLRDPKCKYGEQTKFCKLMKAVWRQNVETLHHMSERRFADAKYRLEKANQAVREVLKKKEKEALLEPLRRALDLESSSMFEVISKCSKEPTKPPCYTIFRGLFDATTKLVEAILEITDGKQKEVIQALYDALKNEGKPTEEAYQQTRKVLTALE